MEKECSDDHLSPLLTALAFFLPLAISEIERGVYGYGLQSTFGCLESCTSMNLPLVVTLHRFRWKGGCPRRNCFCCPGIWVSFKVHSWTRCSLHSCVDGSWQESMYSEQGRWKTFSVSGVNNSLVNELDLANGRSRLANSWICKVDHTGRSWQCLRSRPQPLHISIIPSIPVDTVALLCTTTRQYFEI